MTEPYKRDRMSAPEMLGVFGLPDQMPAERVPIALLPFQIHSPTSIDAAKSMKANAANLREKVFAAISNSPVGMTDEEACAATGISGNTLRPRRVELQRAGRIVSAGTRPTSSGRKAVVWTVKR
jgi:hypothetical protein